MATQMYLGRNIRSGKYTAEKFYMNSRDLTTHVFVCGSTGSGKTVLGKCLIEEAVMAGIPSVIIDLKGDLSSLKIPLFDLTEQEIADYVDAGDADPAAALKKNVDEFRHMLSMSSLGANEVRAFRNKANIRIFTPKSRICEPFSMSFLASPPGDFDEIMKNEPETVLNHISNQASNIVKRLFGEDAMTAMHEEKNLMEAAILHLYRSRADVEGRAGVISLIKTIYDVPFERVGMLKVREFISDERKMNLIRRLNTLLIGAESLWYEGESIDRIMESLVGLEKPADGKTNTYIFNLSFLDSFDDRNLILSNIAMTLFNRMRRLGDSREPRAMFYIDEIGGGKLSFFPEDPVQNESKSAINLLLRQGRAFGLCCVLSTQNPGDIDYRGLTNCHTWYIGKLLTKADRDKVIQGISATPYFIESYENLVKSAGSGDFIARAKDGSVSAFKERWLLTYHKVLTYDDFITLRKQLYVADDLFAGSASLTRGDHASAIASFQKILQKAPDSTKAIGLLGEAYFGSGARQEASACFEKAIRLSDGEYPACKAYYYLGEITLAAGDQARALDMFQRSVKSDPQFADSYLRSAELLHRASRNQEALQSVQKFVVLKPAPDDGYYLMAKVQLSLSDLFAAEASAKKAFSAAKEGPARYRARFIEAKINYHMGQYAHGLEILAEAQKLAAENSIPQTECEILLSAIYVKFGETAKAVSCLESIIAREPSNEEAVKNLAELHYAVKQPDRVIETLERLAKINPSCATIYNLRARLLLDAGKSDEAMKVALSAPPEIAGYDLIETVKGLVLEAMEKPEAAVECYRRALALDPRSEEATYMIARDHERRGDLENQRSTLVKLIEFAPDEKYYFDLGLCLEKMNRYAEALEAFNRLYLTSLQKPEISLKKADWYRKSGNIPKAIECVEAFIKARPGSPDGYLVKGEIYTAEKKYDEALDIYDRAEKMSRGDLKVWISRSFTYREMGDFDKADYCSNRAMGRE